MSFGYAQDNDAFKDFDDLRLRNQRFQQDILNQRRNASRMAAQQQFEMWQKNPNAFGGDIPTGDYYGLNAYGRSVPFTGVPSITQSMEGLRQSGGLKRPDFKRVVYRTDENGNLVRLTDDEIALRRNAASDLQKQAASEAGNWYDFLKNPQNTPYEQKQMRNHEIMRDAALAAMMTKPIFNPDTDISEGMARMAGQQQGMAQGAMENYLKRQGMSADAYNSATKLATNYAAQSLQAMIQSQQENSAAENYEREAQIRAKEAETLFGKKSPEYVAAVKNKDLAKQQELATQRDTMLRAAMYLQSEAQKHRERSKQFLGKANSFGEGAKKISQDWELGLNFDFGNIPTSTASAPSVGEFGKQGDTGANVGGIFAHFPNTGAETQTDARMDDFPAGATEVPPSAETAPTGPANASTDVPAKAPTKPVSGGEKYSFDGTKLTKTDPIMKRIANLSMGRDVDIAKWKAKGARIDLDTGYQAAADKNDWLTDLQAIANDIVSRPENFAKYKDFVYKVIEGGDRFGNAANIFMTSSMNIPRYKGLFNYRNDIMAYGDDARNELQENYLQMEKGFPLTKQEVKRTELLLSSPDFQVKNMQGHSEPILKNNGLKLKAVEARDSKGNPILDEKGQKMYFVDIKDSFK